MGPRSTITTRARKQPNLRGIERFCFLRLSPNDLNRTVGMEGN